MNEPDARTSNEREKLLRKVWLLRQLVSALLLVGLLALFFSARHGHFEWVESAMVFCLVSWPFYAVGIALWDRHWVWKHQDRMLDLWKRLE